MRFPVLIKIVSDKMGVFYITQILRKGSACSDLQAIQPIVRIRGGNDDDIKKLAEAGIIVERIPE